MTHTARQKAHKHFDEIWKEGYLTRTQAYRALSGFMGLTSEECHIKLFNVDQCKQVIKFSKDTLERLIRESESQNYNCVELGLLDLFPEHHNY